MDKEREERVSRSWEVGLRERKGNWAAGEKTPGGYGVRVRLGNPKQQTALGRLELSTDRLQACGNRDGRSSQSRWAHGDRQVRMECLSKRNNGTVDGANKTKRPLAVKHSIVESCGIVSANTPLYCVSVRCPYEQHELL